MSTINNSQKFKDIVDDLKKKNLNVALVKLKDFSLHHPDNYLVDKLFASIYFKKKDWKNTIKYYEKILPQEKEKFRIYNNIGVALFKLGKINQSVKVFEKAIHENPRSDLAYCNLGISYSEIGKYKKAIDKFIAALNHNKNNAVAMKNLINILSLYNPINIDQHPLLNINDKITKIYSVLKINNIYKEENIKKILIKSENIINTLSNHLYLDETQLFRRNSLNLNCDRHFKIFNKFDIIPKYCFACYKVQINLINVIDLIKLFFIFDNLNLKNNNIRKCIVELRSSISGNYKGYIYCDGLDEAKEISEYINKFVEKINFEKITILIKHGCSEFYKSYPEYEKINFDEKLKITYDKKWEEKELIVDNSYPKRIGKDKKIWSKTLNGLNLQDILIIKNWLNYAHVIGDFSYKKIYPYKIKPNFINSAIGSKLAFRKNNVTKLKN